MKLRVDDAGAKAFEITDSFVLDLLADRATLVEEVERLEARCSELFAKLQCAVANLNGDGLDAYLDDYPMEEVK